MKKLFFALAMLALFACQHGAQKAGVSLPSDTTSVVMEEVAPSIEAQGRADSIARAEFVADSLEFRRITKLVNGGYNGFDDRWAIYLRARKVLMQKDTTQK